MKNNIFPELNTERLTLRKLEESDSEVILFLRSDETVNKFIYRLVERRTKNINDALGHIKMVNVGAVKGDFFTWGITLKNEQRIIGSICLWNFSTDRKKAEVGYDLHPNYHRQGIMNEALDGVLIFGFKELKLKKMEAFTHKDNESSKKLLLRNGFTLAKDRKDPGNASNVIFEILNTE